MARSGASKKRAASRAAPSGEASPVVGILMGSQSDRPVMEAAEEVLRSLGIPSETVVASAHRQPDRVRHYAESAARRGIKTIIAGAGMAAHLAGALAAQTNLPVIGVPLAASSLGGIDALLSTAQMPGGVPVATMAIGKAGAKNAAFLAARIIALSDPAVARRLAAYRRRLARG